MTGRFFDSRWVERPDHVEELDGGLPHGFRAAAGAAGIKPSGKPDVALLVCDRAEGTSAARFTRSGVLAAPVLLTQERCRLGGLRTVVANSGNANAATGKRGLDAAVKMQVRYMDQPPPRRGWGSSSSIVAHASVGDGCKRG